MFNNIVIYLLGRKKREINVANFFRIPRFGDTMHLSKMIHINIINYYLLK